MTARPDGGDTDHALGEDHATYVAPTDWASGVAPRFRALLSEGDAAERLYREAIVRLGRIRLPSSRDT